MTRGAFGDLWANWKQLARLAKDEHFRKFLAHPKVQELMKDPDFKQAVLEKNVFKLTTHQGFAQLMKDPKVRSTLEGLSKKLKKSDYTQA